MGGRALPLNWAYVHLPMYLKVESNLYMENVPVYWAKRLFLLFYWSRKMHFGKMRKEEKESIREWENLWNLFIFQIKFCNMRILITWKWKSGHIEEWLTPILNTLIYTWSKIGYLPYPHKHTYIMRKLYLVKWMSSGFIILMIIVRFLVLLFKHKEDKYICWFFMMM